MEFHDQKTNRRGTVIFVDQGRIRVDFNHPLAGRKVEYRLKPLERIDKFEDKVFAFVSRRVPGVEQERFNIDFNKSDNTLNIHTPDLFGLQQGVGMQEFYISYDLQNNLDVGTVNFIHSYKKPPTPEPHDHDHDHDHDHGVELGKDEETAKEIAKPSKNKKKSTAKTKKKKIKLL